MVDFQCGFIEMKVHGISIFPTHNLEVPGSSPGWSTKKESPNGGSFLFNKPGLSPAGYLLRLWFAPTLLTTNPQSMGLYETNLKPRLVHKERIAQMEVLFCVIILCFVNKCSLLTRNSLCLKRINEVIMPILSFIINKNVIFVCVINRNRCDISVIQHYLYKIENLQKKTITNKYL